MSARGKVIVVTAVSVIAGLLAAGALAYKLVQPSFRDQWSDSLHRAVWSFNHNEAKIHQIILTELPEEKRVQYAKERKAGQLSSFFKDEFHWGTKERQRQNGATSDHFTTLIHPAVCFVALIIGMIVFLARGQISFHHGIALCLVATAGVFTSQLSIFSRKPPESHLARNIPLHLGEFEGREMEVDSVAQEILETQDLLMRVYINRVGEPVTFAAVFAMDNRRAVHPPAQCYTGQGFSLERSSTLPVEVVYPDPDMAPGLSEDDLAKAFGAQKSRPFEIAEFLIKQGPKAQLVMFWYKSGRDCTAFYGAHEWHMLKNDILYRASSNSLLRVSIPLDNIDEAHAREVLLQFVQAVFPYVLYYLP